MKFQLNHKYVQIAILAVIVIVLSGFLLMSVNDAPNLGEMAKNLKVALTPVIWGLIIAYLLNPAVDFFRFKVFKKWGEGSKTKKRERTIRNLSIFIVFVIAPGLLTGLAFLIIPQLMSSISGLVANFSSYVYNFIDWATENFSDIPQIKEILENPMTQLENLVSTIWANISEDIISFGSKIGGGALTFLIGFKDFIIGFVISIYLLASKDMVKAQMKKILFAMMKNDRVQSILTVMSRTNDIFIHYITSTLIDAFFIGCLTFIGATVMGMPYPVFLTVVIAVTNIIPFFGPFIGGIPCCFLILLVDPVKSIIFAIFILVIQQLDGNVIKPLLFGETMGLPALWVLIGIIVGGGLFGFMGMLLAVPVFAIIYMLVKEVVENKLEKKGLPTESLVYEKNDTHKYKDGYKYSDEEQKSDAAWIASLRVRKKKKLLFKKDKEDNGGQHEGTASEDQGAGSR